MINLSNDKAMRFFNFFLLVLAGLFFAVSVGAQNAPAEEKNVYEDVPEEYLDEAIAFHSECLENHRLNRFFNCDCMASRYLDERLSHPNDTKEGLIILARKDCFDTTELAGDSYLQCLNTYPESTVGKRSKEAYCFCVANMYAKTLEEMQQTTYLARIDAEVQAKRICMTPPVAR